MFGALLSRKGHEATSVLTHGVFSLRYEGLRKNPWSVGPSDATWLNGFHSNCFGGELGVEVVFEYFMLVDQVFAG